MRGRGVAAGAAAGGVLLAVYLAAAFVLPGAADVRAYSSGIFDMDVSRVVSDLATAQPAYRESVHPLQKLLVAGIGRGLDAVLFGGRDPLAAARVVIAFCTMLQVLATGALAWQLTRHRASAALAAMLVGGFSFSAWLAASIPESAAVAAVAGLLPLLLLNARWGRRFTWIEAGGWALLGVLALGLTLTQVVHCVIALGVRATRGREAPPDAVAPPAAAGPGMGLRLGATAVLFALLLGVGLLAQARLYPSAPRRDAAHPLTAELHYLRSERLLAMPVRHLAAVLGHFAVIDFVAPNPGHSDFLIRDSGLRYWSLSLEEAGPAQWTIGQRALALAVLVALAFASIGLRRADARFLAPGLCVASQFALHAVYGREYVLYSPHWHGVWVALLVAAAWRAFPRRGALMLGVAGALAVALLANDIAVMRVVYREVEAGLGVEVRDARGALLAAE